MEIPSEILFGGIAAGFGAMSWFVRNQLSRSDKAAAEIRKLNDERFKQVEKDLEVKYKLFDSRIKEVEKSRDQALERNDRLERQISQLRGDNQKLHSYITDQFMVAMLRVADALQTSTTDNREARADLAQAAQSAVELAATVTSHDADLFRDRTPNPDSR